MLFWHFAGRCGDRIEIDQSLAQRLRQCESLGEYAMSEHIREILKAEQEHLIDLATALGEDPPKIPA